MVVCLNICTYKYFSNYQKVREIRYAGGGMGKIIVKVINRNKSLQVIRSSYLRQASYS